MDKHEEREEDDVLVQEVLDFLDCIGICPLPNLPYDEAVKADQLLQDLPERFGPWEHKERRLEYRS
jgi:hypothetical protein